MGIFGNFIAPAFGAAIGSIWDKEKEGKDIGRSIGQVIPFQRGGKMRPVYNLYQGPVLSPMAAGGIPRERPAPHQPKRMRKGGKAKKGRM